MNLLGAPNSWFDALLAKEAAPPDLAEWRAVVRDAARVAAITGSPVPSVLLKTAEVDLDKFHSAWAGR
jgi:hypothetical protein